MARRKNDLFLGKDFLDQEGLNVKHPGRISLYANPNINKIKENPVDLVGLDIETDAVSAELKLIGFWNGEKYVHYTSNFIVHLFEWTKYCYRKQASFAYWNKLDSFLILKQFLLEVEELEQKRSLEHYGKISGEWNKKNGEWYVKPVIEIDLGDYYFGIKNAIRSSIQLYFRNKMDTKLYLVWAFDVKQLFESGLELEASRRLDYYSKVDETAHLVDWNRFETDDDYRTNTVLRSNELDCRAVHDLGRIVQEDFKEAFGYYPNTLVSQGSLARSAIVAELTNHYKKMYPDDEKETVTQRKQFVLSDFKSVGIMDYYDNWVTLYGEDFVKDLYCLTTEAYSGGYIESIAYGYAKEGYFSDIASAYPAAIVELWDLRGAKLYHGKGEPPRKENTYVFIRGDVNIPDDVDFHAITIKHPVNKETNIRAVGEYRAAYILEERDFLERKGATFENEEWYAIETKGQPSALARVAQRFLDLRKTLKSQGKSSQYMAKIAANSLYGILYEAVDTYDETKKEVIERERTPNYYKELLSPYKKSVNLSNERNDLDYYLGKEKNRLYAMWHNPHTNIRADQVAQELEGLGLLIDSQDPAEIIMKIDTLYRYGDKNVENVYHIDVVEKAGYRAGEFWNPIFASIITAKTRLLMSEAATAIKNAGGQVIVMMTDSILWQGDSTMLPSRYIREEKTTGYFEKPEHVKDIICLGSGRYGFMTDKGYQTTKRRGLNVVDIQSPDGIRIGGLNWLKALDTVPDDGDQKLHVNVRTLISPGQLLSSRSLDVNDLGRIVEETREVDLLVGNSKRDYPVDVKASELKRRLVQTKPLYLGYGMTGQKLLDQTFPTLRKKVMACKTETRKERRKKQVDKATKKYHQQNADAIQERRTRNYEQLKAYGYDTVQATRMCGWSIDKVQQQLLKDGKI